MRFPTIHSNGTSYDTLRGEYYSAYTAVNQALDAVARITCHGRDYYVQESVSGDPASEAFNEKHLRVSALEKIKNELVDIILNLDKQQKIRKG